MEEFAFDDIDQELIEALAGNFCDEESDPFGSGQSDNDDDGRGDQDNDTNLDFHWDIDDDYGVIVGNVVGETSQAVKDDNVTIDSIKGKYSVSFTVVHCIDTIFFVWRQ